MIFTYYLLLFLFSCCVLGPKTVKLFSNKEHMGVRYSFTNFVCHMIQLVADCLLMTVMSMIFPQVMWQICLKKTLR